MAQIAVGTKDEKLTFEVPEPYAEGHQISAIEAKVLNQSFKENIGNNMRRHVQAFLTGADDAEYKTEDDLRKFVESYAKDYEFTEAAVGTGRTTMTPEEKEAKKLATEIFDARIKEAGYKSRKAYDEAKGEGAAAAKIATFAEHEDVQKAAKANVKRRESLASSVLGEAA